MNNKILILGGDIRQLAVADAFIKDGRSVSVAGFNSSFFESPYNTYKNVNSAIKENDIIILGLPFSKDKIYLNAPCFDNLILLSDIIDNLNENKIIIGGMINKDFNDEVNKKGGKCFDYFTREELIVKNTIPTVEGAIAIAMEETAFTLHGSECLVCGFGRIGKLLAETLRALKCNVTVSARNLEDFAWIDCFSYKRIKTSDILYNINKYQIVFNTVPNKIIDEECLKRTRKDCLIIDLASKPGGIDFKYAKLLGVKTIWALSLPGKVAPKTAGIIIKNTISNILTESGGK